MDKNILQQKTTALLALSDEKKELEAHEVEGIIDDLIVVITEHNRLYHVEASPVIADVQYDHLLAYLQHLEEKYPQYVKKESPTQKIGAQVQAGFIKKDHGGYCILSLQNSYDAADLRDWDIFLKKQIGEEVTYSFLVEPKFDGSSVHLVYEKGVFVAGITRGDGRVGEDITENMKAVQNLPLFIPALANVKMVRLRGEVMMPKGSFENLNTYQREEGLPIFANERNATAGTLRQLDPEVVRKRGLVIFVHELLDWSYTAAGDFSTDSEVKNILSTWGFPLFAWSKRCNDIEEVITLCEDSTTKEYLEKQNLLFDGLVVKLDQLSLREQLGTTDHHPRRAMAYKFPAEQIVTRLEDITYQVGRTGVITPVAELDPVILSGAKISRATLHNFDYIEKYDIRKNDMVWVQRSGEVIPYIVGPVVQQRTGDEIIVETPAVCPSCGTGLIRHEGEVAWLCPNMQGCLAQKKEQIKHFVSKHCMNITGLGNSLVDMLVEQGLIQQRPDIWHLTDPSMLMQLRGLPGIASKKIQQLMIELEKTKQAPLWRLLHALGISYIGKKIARSLEQYIVSLHTGSSLDVSTLAMCLRDRDALQEVYGLGTQSIDALVGYFSNESLLDLLYQAQENGMMILLPHDASDGVLSGKKIAITGTFSVSRDTMTSLLQAQGAHIVTSISAKTDMLIVGENPGSKYTKAQELGIVSMSWEVVCTTYHLSPPQPVIPIVSSYETPSLFG